MVNRLRRATKISIAAAAGAMVLVLLGLIWWFQRDEAPEAVDLESAVAQVEAAEATSDSSDTPTAGAFSDEEQDVDTTSSTETDTDTTNTAAPSTDETDTETATADQTVDALEGITGVWMLQVADNAGDLLGEPAVSFAGFRVNEVLAGGIGDFTAVGRTADVSGWIELTETALVAAEISVDFTTLRTDNGSRDGQVRRALNTNEFPLGTFTLVEPIEVPADAAQGQSFSASAHGDLTIKGVTDRATFDLEAQLVDDTLVVVGSAPIVFGAYGVTVPSAPIVVSAEDHGITEFQLLFTR